MKVTHRRSVSGHVQLARRSDRYLPQTRIEYPRRRVQNRTTQAGCLAPLNRGSHRVDRELRRPVKVVPVDTVLIAQSRPQLGRYSFSAEHHQHRRPLTVEETGGHQFPCIRGGYIYDVDTDFAVMLHQRRGVQSRLLVDHVNFVPREQPEQFLPRHVERERDCMRDAQTSATHTVFGRSEYLGLVIVIHRRQPAVTHHDALGFSGTARGVDDVGRLVR